MSQDTMLQLNEIEKLAESLALHNLPKIDKSTLADYGRALYQNRLRLQGSRALNAINKGLKSTRLIFRGLDGLTESYVSIEIATRGKDVLVMRDGLPTWVFVANYNGVDSVLLKVSVKQYFVSNPVTLNITRLGNRTHGTATEIKLSREFTAYMDTIFSAETLYQWDSKIEKFGQAKSPTTPLNYSKIDGLIERMVESLMNGNQDSHESNEYFVEPQNVGDYQGYSLATRFSWNNAIERGIRREYPMTAEQFTIERDSLIERAKSESAKMFDTQKIDKFVVSYNIKLQSAVVTIK